MVMANMEQQHMEQGQGSRPANIYLDNAATSFPKPESVVEAIRSCLGHSLTVARSTHMAEFRADDILRRCRARLAAFINASVAEEIVFTYSATDGLNLAINGLLPQGAHAIVSPLEHHSVMRPLYHRQRSGLAEFSVLPADPAGLVDPAAIHSLLRPETSCIIINWISNVSGVVQPVQEIGRLARELGIPLLIDASQAAGSHAIDVQALGCTALVMPGHKAMMSIPGTGILYLDRECELPPWRIGGTGFRSELLYQPEERPQRYESGTPNVAGIIGLDAALDWFAATGMDVVSARCRELTGLLAQGLSNVEGIRLIGPGAAARRGCVLSFSVNGVDPLAFSEVLASQFGISTRPGLHCAPSAHKHYETLESGGTVRLSTGFFTTEADIELSLQAIQETVAGFQN